MDKNLTHPAYTAARNIFNREGKVLLLRSETFSSVTLESPTVPPTAYYREKLRDYFKASSYGSLTAYAVNSTLPSRTPIKTRKVDKPKTPRIELRELFWIGSQVEVEWDIDAEKPLHFNGSPSEWVQFINGLFWSAKVSHRDITALDIYRACFDTI